MLLADPTSEFAKANGSDGYSRVEHLLFLILDQLRAANWQRGGGKGKRPKPMSPLNQGKGEKRMGTKGLSDEEVEARLREMNPGRGDTDGN